MHALVYTILCKGLEHPQTLVSAQNQFPVDTEGQMQLRFWGVKTYTWIFNCAGVRTPNPHVVQGSTVHQIVFYVDI